MHFHKTKPGKWALLFAVMSLFLSACGQRVQTEVTAFHTLPVGGGMAGKTFEMLPTDKQSGSLE